METLDGSSFLVPSAALERRLEVQLLAMPDSGSRDRPTYSTRLMSAFFELLEEYDDIPGFSSRTLESMGERVLVEVAHQALAIALEFTKDPDFGLKAARRHVVGDAGAYYYVVSSS